ncbi:hypothetical protein PLESTF_001567800 [Pleodorina starrii]|nr:hypothetical protein PLESTF_001567800 [Pleodorina starrii]
MQACSVSMAAAPASEPDDGRRSPVRFVLFKQSVITAHNSHFAGGKHAFLCMATALAAESFDVHVVSIATRGKVLVHAGMVGLLPMLSFARPGVVTWREQRVNHHVILQPDDSPPSGAGPAAGASLATAVSSYVADLAHNREAPKAPPPAASTSGSQAVQALLAQASPVEAVDRLSGNNAPGRQGGSAAVGPGSSNRECGSGGVSAGGRAALGGTCWVIVDADESQKLLLPLPHNAAGLVTQAAADASPTPNPSSNPNPDSQDAARAAIACTSNCAAFGVDSDAADRQRTASAGATAATLFEAIVAAAPPRRCLSYVQNVHFLPMGPSGTGPRRPELLSAWSRLAAVLAVSEFIADYVRRHWPSASSPDSVPAAPVRVVPLAAWGVFGQPPFPDLAAVARPQLRAWRAAPAAAPAPLDAPVPIRPAVAAPPPPPPPPPVVDVAVLKLTPEKGASIVVELARRMRGRVRFRVVTGDPAAASALAPLAKPGGAAGPSKSSPESGSGSCSSSLSSSTSQGERESSSQTAVDAVSGASGAAACTAACATATATVTATAPSSSAALELWEPQPDVGRVLRGCVAVLAPSLWLEAWGMVVTEALLRGLPVLLSDLGGLPEAGMRLCPAVRVAPIRIPPDAQGTPDWAARTYPKQDIGAWERALMALLLRQDDGPGAATATAAAADNGSGAATAAAITAVTNGRGGPSGDAANASGSGGGGGGGGSADGGVGDGGDGEEGDAWERLSRWGRQAALAHVCRGPEFRVEWLDWLAGLGCRP